MSKGIWGSENTPSNITGKTGHKPSDTDVNSDSPHHTLGKGPTQAAPGNHTHLLVGEPGNGGGGIDLSGSSIYGRNRIINGDFSVNQRGQASYTTGGTYGLDRWGFYSTTAGASYLVMPTNLGDLPESAPTYARLVNTLQSAAGDYSILAQPIEYVRSLSGKVVTVSFWARALSGTPSIAVELQQAFGTGGSPSSPVYTFVGKAKLTTAWARYSVTASLPSIVGKFLGNSNDDALHLNLWTSAGSNFNARTGSLGIQNTTIDFWGVQVEEGPYATPYEQKTYADELRACQRYYYRLNQSGIATRYALGNASTSANWDGVITTPVPMRAQPIITQGGTLWALSDAGVLAQTSVTIGPYTVTQPAFPTNQIWITLTGGTGTLVAQRMYYLENDGGTGAFIEFNAEF